MNGNEITNHLNAAIVACELAKRNILHMTEARYPALVNKITAEGWQTAIYSGKEALEKGLDHLEEARVLIDSITEVSA